MKDSFVENVPSGGEDMVDQEKKQGRPGAGGAGGDCPSQKEAPNLKNLHGHDPFCSMLK